MEADTQTDKVLRYFGESCEDFLITDEVITTRTAPQQSTEDQLSRHPAERDRELPSPTVNRRSTQSVVLQRGTESCHPLQSTEDQLSQSSCREGQRAAIPTVNRRSTQSSSCREGRRAAIPYSQQKINSVVILQRGTESCHPLQSTEDQLSHHPAERDRELPSPQQKSTEDQLSQSSCREGRRAAIPYRDRPAERGELPSPTVNRRSTQSSSCREGQRAAIPYSQQKINSVIVLQRGTESCHPLQSTEDQLSHRPAERDRELPSPTVNRRSTQSSSCREGQRAAIPYSQQKINSVIVLQRGTESCHPLQSTEDQLSHRPAERDRELPSPTVNRRSTQSSSCREGQRAAIPSQQKINSVRGMESCHPLQSTEDQLSHRPAERDRELPSPTVNRRSTQSSSCREGQRAAIPTVNRRSTQSSSCREGQRAAIPYSQQKINSVIVLQRGTESCHPLQSTEDQLSHHPAERDGELPSPTVNRRSTQSSSCREGRRAAIPYSQQKINSVIILQRGTESCHPLQSTEDQLSHRPAERDRELPSPTVNRRSTQSSSCREGRRAAIPYSQQKINSVIVLQRGTESCHLPSPYREGRRAAIPYSQQKINSVIVLQRDGELPSPTVNRRSTQSSSCREGRRAAIPTVNRRSTQSSSCRGTESCHPLQSTEDQLSHRPAERDRELPSPTVNRRSTQSSSCRELPSPTVNRRSTQSSSCREGRRAAIPYSQQKINSVIILQRDGELPSPTVNRRSTQSSSCRGTESCHPLQSTEDQLSGLNGWWQVRVGDGTHGNWLRYMWC